MAGPKAEPLGRILGALRNYPRPAVAQAEGGVRYLPPLALAVDLYARHFQRAENETLIAEAFAAVLPKVLGRCRALISAALNAVADGGAPGATEAPEYLSLVGELSSLATMFVGRAGGGAFAGPLAPQYAAVCDMLEALRGALPEAR